MTAPGLLGHLIVLLLLLASSCGEGPQEASYTYEVPDAFKGWAKVEHLGTCPGLTDKGRPVVKPVSYTHLTLPTKRIV